MHDIDKIIIADTLKAWDWGFQADEVIEQIEVLLHWYGTTIVSYRLCRVDKQNIGVIINHSEDYKFHSFRAKDTETFNLYVNTNGLSRHEYYLEVKTFDKLL